ncbi:MAG: protein translocase subunit SecD [Candidatus Hydrothermota bacterium]|nr:MAG: protein translocase subunit SecD [Candidatus Hydrothermae bacterium]
MSPEERAKLPKSELLSLRKKAINLGLDLQGGMYLMLEIDKTKLPPDEDLNRAVERAIEIIRNRVDQWGVFEPSIQKLKDDRILVQLPGVLDRDRAVSLIGRTALLEFKLVAKEDLIEQTFKAIDKVLRLKEVGDTTQIDTTQLGPFTQYFRAFERNVVVREDDVPKIDSILNLPEVKKVIPAGYEFLWGKSFEVQGVKYRPLFLVKAEPELTGAHIKNALHTIGTGTDPQVANRPIVLLEFDRKGASKFAAVTGANVGRRLAIVLDNLVQSAPVIQERIPGGRARITGFESLDEAKELAIVLRAGALPAPVKIVEERTVGPSLGRDSIRRGIMALLIGVAAVMLFMIIYYRLSGVIADFALILEMFFIVAFLAGLHATLTLPGLAGLILTAGIAVDANVLIFERIREELRAGKPPATAVDTAYKRAQITIFDANLTTLIAALVLFKFGTGPIKGFGTTLSLGIIINFFTAIFVTRIIFDYLTKVKQVEAISI